MTGIGLKAWRFLLAGALLVVGGISHAQGAAAAPGAAGELAVIGAYPLEQGNATLTGLPDGRLFFYGVRRGTSKQSSPADKWPRERGLFEGNSRLIGPQLWDSPRQGWTKVARPPECPNNSFLATATALPNGKVLVAGGLCDAPRMGNDASAREPYRHLSLWNSVSGQWERAPDLADSRIFHTASAVGDGVLIVGGERDRKTDAGVEPVLDVVERVQGDRVALMPPLNTARARHTAVTLDAGRLLVLGGFDAAGKPLASAELWDTSQGRWTQGPPMRVARIAPAAVLLADGRVMVAGGMDARGRALGSVELRDPATGVWSFGPPLLRPLLDPVATRLPAGSVLLVGGTADAMQPIVEAQLWQVGSGQSDPAGQWVPAGTHGWSGAPDAHNAVQALGAPDGSVRLFAATNILRWTPGETAPRTRPIYGERMRFAAAALDATHVLVSGGMQGGAFLDVAEIYDTRTGRFTQAGRMHQARHSHTALALGDGRTVVAGGWVQSPDRAGDPLANSPEVWSPEAGWTLIDGIRFDWRDWVHMGRLSDGSIVFLASRELADGDPPGPVEYRAWVWDPRTGNVEQKKVPLTPRSRAAIAITPDGTVLAAGGNLVELDSGYRCEVRPHQPLGDGEEPCKDIPAHWVARQTAQVESWNITSGAVRREADMPGYSVADPHTLVLRNGDVVVTDYAEANLYVGPQQRAVHKWDAAAHTWFELPSLDSEEGMRLVELEGGGLLARSMVLPRGAAQWRPVAPRRPRYADTIPLPTGEAFSVSMEAPFIATFDAAAVAWTPPFMSDSPPFWLTRPALAPLKDGRLMVVAALDTGEGAVQQAFVWNPIDHTWRQAGHLARRYGSGQAVQLPSGKVLHVGQFGAQAAVCEIWNPSTNEWLFCGTLKSQGKAFAQRQLGTLGDGSAAIVSGQDQALVFREATNTWLPMQLEFNKTPLAYGVPIRPEGGFYARVRETPDSPWIDASAFAAAVWQGGSNYPPAALWNAQKKEWAYVMLRGQGLGRTSVLLPDGCAVSLTPLRLFDPHTGTVKPLPDLGLGEGHPVLSLVVLADGTVVAADGAHGVTDAPLLFARKASCAGFASVPQDAARMQPDPAKELTTAVRLAAPKEGLLVRIEHQVMEYRAVGAIILACVLVYLLLRRIVRAWRNRANANVAPSRIGSRPFRWTIRIIFYTVALFIGLRFVPGFLWVVGDSDKPERCAAQPETCLNKRGLLEKTPNLSVGGGKDADTRIPCRYVGIWSSIRPGRVYRLILADDGRYSMSNAALGEKYTGYWAVQGNHMVWRHDQRPSMSLDINAIVETSDERFVLREENGTKTRFELIERVKSSKCTP